MPIIFPFLFVAVEFLRLSHTSNSRPSSSSRGVMHALKPPPGVDFTIWCKRDNQGRGYTGFANHPENAGFEDGGCQPWSHDHPHGHSRHFTETEMADRYLPEPELQKKALGSYCRNPDQEPKPWCYTLNPDIRWKFCDDVLPCGVPCESTFTYRGISISGCVWDGEVKANYRNFQCIPPSSNQFKPCTLTYQELNVQIAHGTYTISLNCKSEHVIRVFNVEISPFGRPKHELAKLLITIANECDGKRTCSTPTSKHNSIVKYMCAAYIQGPIKIEKCDYKHCVFPFIFHGIKYTTCILIENSGIRRPICSSTPDYDRDQEYCFCDDELVRFVGLTRVSQTCVGHCRRTQGSKHKWCPTTKDYADDLLWMWC